MLEPLPEEPLFIRNYRALATDKTVELNKALEYVDVLRINAGRYQAVCEMIDRGVAFGLYLNANDTFGYACADGEEADTSSELHEIADLYAKHGYPAILAWMEKKRGTPVLKELRETADKGHAAMATENGS